MGWDIEEEPKKKNNTDKTLKVLGVFMILFVFIIVAIIAVLYALKVNSFVFLVDGENKKFSEKLIKKQNDINYINIQELANILECGFHYGEYKEYSEDKDKCYIVNNNETTSFYLNSTKISKVGFDEYDEDYKNFECEYNTIKIDDEFYAPLDTINVAFAISSKLSNKKLEIYTLPYIIKKTETKINPDKNKQIYNSIQEEDYENQKALLYGFIITCKKENSLYSIKSLNTLAEIVSEKYKKIAFVEETKEFLVTNTIDKVGIIDESGQNKIEQKYDSIKIINTNPKLYLVENDKKYGVIDSNGKVIIYNEYDKIGIDNTKYKEVHNQYVLLNSVIPVQKDNKYGLFTVDGDKILDIKYNGIGCKEETVKMENDTETKVTPVATIEQCKGIVINNETGYDLFLLDTKQLVPLKVSNIYSISDGGKLDYYMLYKGKEMNLIENLIKLGYIRENSDENTNNETTNTITTNNVVDSTNTNNMQLTTTLNNSIS